jgi:hypothetical protein
LPRAGSDDFWQRIEADYAAGDARKWRQLAMFALRETAGWPLELIGLAFQHPKGYVQRSLRRTRNDLRARFRPETYREDEAGSGWQED